MATTPFICDVESSEESLKAAVKSYQLRHRVYSYTLLQVLVGILVFLVLALTGGIIWMKLFQDCPEEVWRVRFTGTNTTFTAPRTQEYVIFGKVFTKTAYVHMCQNSFKLLQTLPHNTTTYEVLKQNISKIFREDYVILWEGARLSVQLNCESEIDENLSELHIYPQHR